MSENEKVLKELPRFEPVFQLYDGLGGKIIKWSKEHGGTSDDPSVQAFVVAADGRVQARAPDATAYNPGNFAKWLGEQAAAFEKSHPRTKMPFVRAEVSMVDGEPRCAALSSAREEGRPVLLYFGRDFAAPGEKAHQKEAAAARKFEKKTLDSKSAAEAAKGMTLLRFDLADEEQAAFAKTLGVTAAPRLFLIAPGAGKPEDLGERISASTLTYRLKKALEEK